MHNSIVIFIIKLLKHFRRTHAPIGVMEGTGAAGWIRESKGDWMLKVLIGNFIIKVIKRGKCHPNLRTLSSTDQRWVS